MARYWKRIFSYDTCGSKKLSASMAASLSSSGKAVSCSPSSSARVAAIQHNASWFGYIASACSNRSSTGSPRLYFNLINECTDRLSSRRRSSGGRACAIGGAARPCRNCAVLIAGEPQAFSKMPERVEMLGIAREARGQQRNIARIFAALVVFVTDMLQSQFAEPVSLPSASITSLIPCRIVS